MLNEGVQTRCRTDRHPNLNKGIEQMERTIDGILVGLMVSVAFLANYTYLMS